MKKMIQTMNICERRSEPVTLNIISLKQPSGKRNEWWRLNSRKRKYGICILMNSNCKIDYGNEDEGISNRKNEEMRNMKTGEVASMNEEGRAAWNREKTSKQ